jgi:hypothetical protein
MMVRSLFPLNTADVFHLQFAAYEWHVGTPEKIYATYEQADWDRWLNDWYPVAVKLQADSIPNLHFYPPIVGAALAPLADVSAKNWLTIVAVINVLLIFVIAWQTLLFTKLPISTRTYLWAVALGFACNGFTYCIKFGQVSALLAAATWTGILALRSQHWTKAGAIIGVTSIVKLSPMGILALPFLRNQWRPMIAGFITLCGLFGIAILWLGLDIHQTWWAATKYLSNHVWPNVLDQSLTAWYVRAIKGYSMHAMYFHATSDIRFLRLAALLVFGAVCAYFVFKTRRVPHDVVFPAAIGLVLCSLLLTLPFAWSYYLMVLLPVLAWGLLETLNESWWSMERWCVWLSTFLICVRLFHFYGDTPFRSFLTGSHTLGVIILWGWLITKLLRLSKAYPLPVESVRAAT